MFFGTINKKLSPRILIWTNFFLGGDFMIFYFGNKHFFLGPKIFFGTLKFLFGALDFFYMLRPMS